MRATDPVRDKSMAFSVRIVNLAQYFRANRKEFVMSDQILRSGTSIGANLAEVMYASSKKDFLNKNKIALKECAETLYWIELLGRTGHITAEQKQSLASDGDEIRRILSSICKTLENGIRPPSPDE